ncbi:uncharacterized protein LOC123292890 [Chrysoperla carnea]|uniref:uncharacterized protein LOC123292890 n=1 Tax=Chrysoperla carnea TaxID=189513 RepID=UPI001D0745CF|nr:uncharacterized protein LOC123292890 [Chrysoperla carnea]
MCSIIYVSNLLFLCTIIPSHVTVGLPNIITADRYYSDYIEQNSGSKVLSSSSLYVLGNDIASGIFVDRNIIEEDDASLVPRKLETPFKDEVDILQLLNITHKAPGVSITEGPIKDLPAYKFRLPYGNVHLSNSTPITSILSGKNGFTLIFIYRQQRKTLGSLLSVNPPGRLSPWFQVTSNLRTGQLILHYRITSDVKQHQVYWPITQQHHKAWPLTAWTWLAISVDYNTSTIRLDQDCLPRRYHSLQQRVEQPQSHIDAPLDALVYFRQEPGRKKRFLGSIQVAKLLPNTYPHRLWSCIKPETASISHTRNQRY